MGSIEFASLVLPTPGIHMLPFALSAVALAGALATTQPTFAATASDHPRPRQPSRSSDDTSLVLVIGCEAPKRRFDEEATVSLVIAVFVLLLALLLGAVFDNPADKPGEDDPADPYSW
jgi:hypothetical protein